MERIGWVGTGIMGAAMCGHLLAAAYPVTVFSRTRQKAAGLLDQGASWADSPQSVAEASDVVFTMVGSPNDVRDAVLGEAGVLAGLAPGGLMVDLTTSEPSLAVEISRVAAAGGVQALDAPVSGGDVGAREATLSIMVGGDKEAFARAHPLLARLGSTVVHQGAAGSGQHTKMVNQILIAGTMVGLSEALLYGYRAGLDLERVLKSVSGGAAASWSLSNYAPRILRGDYAPGFSIQHFVKDLGIALEEAGAIGVAVPGLALVHQLYQALRAQGAEGDGVHALIRALTHLSGIAFEPQGTQD